MLDNKSARPGVAAPERANAGNVLTDGDSHQNFTPKPTAGQPKISDFMGCGQENAVSLKRLMAITGWDGRTIRLMIQRERLAGVPILADCKNGYFLAKNEREKQSFVAQMFHRAAEIEKAATAVFAAEVCPVQVVQKSSAPPIQDTMPGWFDV